MSDTIVGEIPIRSTPGSFTSLKIYMDWSDPGTWIAEVERFMAGGCRVKFQGHDAATKAADCMGSFLSSPKFLELLAE